MSTPIVVPPGADKPTADMWKAANPDSVFIVVGTASPAPVAETTDHHRDVVNGWCDTIEDVLAYGGESAKLIVPPAVVTLVVGILKMGTEAVRSALLHEPVRERWTLAQMEAEPPAARPLA